MGVKIKWWAVQRRPAKAVSDSLASGGLDLLIVFNSHLSHPQDQQYSAAARLAGVPYIRAARGRPLAIRLALERDLGIA